MKWETMDVILDRHVFRFLPQKGVEATKRKSYQANLSYFDLIIQNWKHFEYDNNEKYKILLLRFCNFVKSQL